MARFLGSAIIFFTIIIIGSYTLPTFIGGVIALTLALFFLVMYLLGIDKD